MREGCEDMIWYLDLKEKCTAQFISEIVRCPSRLYYGRVRPFPCFFFAKACWIQPPIQFFKSESSQSSYHIPRFATKLTMPHHHQEPSHRGPTTYTYRTLQDGTNQYRPCYLQLALSTTHHSPSAYRPCTPRLHTYTP